MIIDIKKLKPTLKEHIKEKTKIINNKVRKILKKILKKKIKNKKIKIMIQMRNFLSISNIFITYNLGLYM
jgi:hypothetical protein